jgi:hypothetical protein
MPDFRDLCWELVRAMDSYPLRPKAHRELCNQVRLALADTMPAAVASRDIHLALAHIEQKLATIEASIHEMRTFIHYCNDDDDV